MKLKYSGEAIACLARIGRHHHPSNPEAAGNTKSDIQSTIRRISLNPLIYARCGRRAVTRRYRYLVYFKLAEESVIAILSVRHGAERPRFPAGER